jgi:hypothetical protein
MAEDRVMRRGPSAGRNESLSFGLHGHLARLWNAIELQKYTPFPLPREYTEAAGMTTKVHRARQHQGRLASASKS